MQNLLLEFNQDKINKIVRNFVSQLRYYDFTSYDYQYNENWIKALVMHMDHLRQNRYNVQRIQQIIKTLMVHRSRERFKQNFNSGKWEELNAQDFFQVANFFEPSAQMRRAQQTSSTENSTQHIELSKKPITIQNDDEYLVMRAETPQAAIDAKKTIEQYTRRKYNWCISEEHLHDNMFYNYRHRNNQAATAYFVYNKQLPVGDANHALVLHVSKSTVMITNALNEAAQFSSMANLAQQMPQLKTNLLIVQPLQEGEQTTHAYEHSRAFMTMDYDEKMLHIQQGHKIDLRYYRILDKKLQHLYIATMAPAYVNSVENALTEIDKTLQPIYEYHKGTAVLALYDSSSINSIDDLMQQEPYISFIEETRDATDAKYYKELVQRAVDNAAKLLAKTYI